MQKNITNILQAIVENSISFLENDMSVEVLNHGHNFISHNDSNMYISAVCLRGEMNLICVFSIDDSLLQTLYNVFMPYELNHLETQEMLRDLPKEIINTAVGLSIKYFPKPYDTLILSPPINMNETRLKKLLASKNYTTQYVQTQDGLLTCTLIQK